MTEYRDFILPKPAKCSSSQLKIDDPEAYAAVDLMLDDIAGVAASYGIIDPPKFKENLRRLIDLGLVALGLDEYQNVNMYMWHFSEGAYLPVNGECFDKYDMATLVRMNSIMTAMN